MATTFKTLVDAMAAVVANSSSNRAADINNIQNALKDLVSGYSTGTLANPQQLIVVAKAKGDFTSLASAVAAITDASATKPYAILLMPGIYETAEVTLPNFVSLVGVDPKSCVLKATSANVDYVVKAGNYSLIKDIGVINTSVVNGATGACCIEANTVTASIHNCIVNNSATTTTGTTGNFDGILIVDATVDVWNTDITINAPTSNINFARAVVCSGVLAPVTAYLFQCKLNIASGPSPNFSYGIDSVPGLETIYLYNSFLTSIDIGIEYYGAITCENSYIASVANNGYPISAGSSNGKFYNCTVKKHGTATSCFAPAVGAVNICIAHCRMNLASPIHANLTNLIGVPLNVSDTDV